MKFLPFRAAPHDDQVDACTMALNWFQENSGYVGGWLVAQAREFAAQKQLGPKTSAELADAQKRDYVREGGSSIFDERRSSGYVPKTLKAELAERQLEVKPVKACPRCGNTVLARALSASRSITPKALPGQTARPIPRKGKISGLRSAVLDSVT